jgi:AraC-like DNA-binding protein
VTDRWDFTFAEPDPRLRGYVQRYCAYEEQTVSFTRRRELPGDRVVGIVNLGPPIWINGEEVREGFFSGLHDTYAISETRGAQRGVQIDFSPLGAHLLLRIPLHELAGETVPLDALLGVRLQERLGNAADPFAVLDEIFLARLDDALSPVPSITRAPARLRASEGRVPVHELAQELGCSRRHLTAHFRDHVGVAPKLFARILRFQRAVSLIDSEPSWAAIAAQAGYFDQAHLIRDFQQFAGDAPTEFARRRLPDGGGVRD